MLKLDNDFPKLQNTVVINGAQISGEALVSILCMITKPNPKRWYKFERNGDLVTVTQREE